MKNYVIAILVIFCLAACDVQQMTNNSQKATKAAEAAATEAKAQEEKARLAAEKKAEQEKIELEAKSHFNQAFSYIGSAKVASKPDEKEKLFLSAEKEFTNALAKKPDYVDALLNRGVVYIALDKANKAEEDLKKAVSVDGKNAAAHYNLACLYSLTNKVDLAIDSMDAALQNGFVDYDRLRGDPDLKNLRANKEFKKVLEKNKVFLK